MPIDLRALLGYGTGAEYTMVRCPLHADDTASLAVYWDHAFCHGCRAWLGRKDAALALSGLDLSDPASADRIRTALVDRVPVAESDKPLPPLPGAYADLYARLLWDPARSDRLGWLADRGLVPDTVERFGLGHDGARFVIPVWDADRQLVTLRYRLDPEYTTPQALKQAKYKGVEGRNGWHLYPAWLLATEPAERATYAVVAEGELDAARVYQDGWIAATGTNGAAQLHKLPRALKEVCPSVRTLYLAMDQDEAGHVAAEHVRAAAEAEGMASVRWRWSGAKDLTDLLLLRPDAIEVLMRQGGAVLEPWERVELWLPEATTQPMLLSG